MGKAHGVKALTATAGLALGRFGERRLQPFASRRIAVGIPLEIRWNFETRPPLSDMTISSRPPLPAVR
jgi:hypothetical protein